MSATHLHLMINHVSILGSIFATFILLYGLLVKNSHVKTIAYGLMIVAAIAGIITMNTGEAAEETVESIAGISKNTIETHEEAAEAAMIPVYAGGLLALAGLYAEWKKKSLVKPVSLVALVVSLVAAVLLARVGLLGGKVRHTEITSITIQTDINQNEGSKRTDD